VSPARDPYEVLGVPRTASTRQIRTAYLRRARHAHPDIVGRRGLEVMRTLNEAWSVLKDSTRRSAYDAAGARPGADDRPSPQPAPDASRPFWTGAAGPPPGRPSGPVLDFGIYAGWSLGEIARRDRGYLDWLRGRPEARPVAVELATLLDPAAGDAEPSLGRRR
jgi:curved DNA-binding protein CbpA